MSTRPHVQLGDAAELEALVDGGRCGELMRKRDWSQTRLGSVKTWPQSLRSALSICLGSRFPIAIYWGDELVLLYNDAWSPIPGNKHPWALGSPARAVWPEIWDTIGPLFEQVMTTGQATYSEDSLLLMHRHGYTEECYFNFTFSPIRGEGRQIAGVFNAVIETTFRVLAERRSKALRELAERTANARTVHDACALAAEALAAHPADAPFCAIYLASEDGRTATLAARAGAPLPRDGAPSTWPLADVVQPATGFAPVSTALWPEAVHTALVAPVRGAQGSPIAWLVIGASPRRAVDDEYRHFAERAAGHLSSALGIATAYEEEKRRAEALAELDRAKTTFFSNVSHELRTPLTLLLGPTTEALASPDRALKGGDLERVHRNAQRLLKLVNTLLEFSRIEAGRAHVHFAPTDLAALTRDLASAFRSLMEKGGLELVVDCPPLPEPVWVDRSMYEKVVLNLLSNAFKFTLKGSVRVALGTRDAVAQLTVTDSGGGIPEVELPHLFERFHRVEGTKGRSYEGSGIGLALVQELVKLHGGTVKADSKVGQGTRFTVSLPLGTRAGDVEPAAPTEASSLVAPFVDEAAQWLGAPSPTPKAVRAGGKSAGHVLLADDNADMRAYVRQLLENDGLDVESVSDGGAALERAMESPPDLVLTDVMMPGVGGFELLEALRSREETRFVPVILLSARAGEESRVEGLGAGADDYLVKPFTAKELLARVRAHLSTSRSRREEARIALGLAKELKLADQRKDEFLAMLAHELRNPMAAISMALQLLDKSDGDPARSARHRQTARRQMGHLVRLVDDLLDVSRITNGKIELRREPIDLAHVVQSALTAARGAIEGNRHQLTLDIANGPYRMNADATRLEQVIVNLLTNAAKYTDAGGRISVSLAREGHTAVLRVRDTGRGIPHEMLGRVFDLFVQVDPTLDRRTGGLGLGLTLVKKLVAMHGGTVEAHSEGLGKGAELVVRLPVDAPADGAGPDLSLMPAASTPAVKREVVLVEDSEDVRETLRELLEHLGHTVEVAQTGLEGVECVLKKRPQIALVDIGLPGIDGYEVARRVRASRDGRDVYLVALTGYGGSEVAAAAKSAGFDAHLTKPVDVDVLTEVLERRAQRASRTAL
ncbi:MAG: response regulator [Myxococcaceae bacterium]|nr:response regulator [Myxococcaceae bacterium]